MNKKKAIAVISKSKGINLYQLADGSKWLSNGYVAYNMGNLPWCEKSEEVAALLGLTPKQESDAHINIASSAPLFEDNEVVETLEHSLVSIAFSDTYEIFIRDSGELLFVKKAWLAPFDGEATYKLIKSGEYEYIRIDYGFINAGFIGAEDPIGYKVRELKRIAAGLSKLKEDNDD